MADPTLSRLSDVLFWTALVIYAVAMVVSFAGLAYRARRVQLTGIVILWAGAAAHTGWAIARGMSVDRVPWGNMFEYSSMIALVLVLVYLIFLDARMKLRQVAGFATGAALLSMGGAALLYVPPMQLQPALNSQWLRVHVIAAILGSTLFGLSFIFTVLYLIKDRAERKANAAAVGPADDAIASDVASQPASDGHASDGEGLPEDLVTPDAAAEERAAAGASSSLTRMPAAAKFDTLAHRTVLFAFPIWTFAVIAGAMWAHRAWGRYWGWDPKETWAFVTWVVYAGYLHARATVGWKGTRAAIVNIVGFACVLFTYFAVNLLISGLHSYKSG